MNAGQNRFGMMLVVAALLAALLIALAAWFGRDNLFRYLIQPRAPFQVSVPPPVPDYSRSESWITRPASAASEAGQSPDIFFIHPNASWSPRDWNVPVDDPAMLAVLEGQVMPNHAGPFAAAGRVWAPRYRQATLFALLAVRPDTHDALDLAYADLARAWYAFASQREEGRPFVLVGSGQGASHLLRLLAREIRAAPVRADLVAAYVLEQGAGLQLFAEAGSLAGMAPCLQPTDTGCVASWVSVDRGNARARRYLLERASRQQDGFALAPGDRPACLNPLSGTADTSAPASANRGSATATGLGAEAPALLPGETGAACVDGLLEVEPGRPSALRPGRYTLGTLHKPATYNLFWHAISADVARRTAAWRAAYRATE
jgi:hypothetical protein